MKCFKLNSVLTALIALLLAGCSSQQGDSFSRSNVYERVVPYNEALVLPSDLDRDMLEDRYPIPKVHDRGELERRHVVRDVSPPRARR